MEFVKGDRIKALDRVLSCVVADELVAVFGDYREICGGYGVNVENLVIIHQSPDAPKVTYERLEPIVGSDATKKASRRWWNGLNLKVRRAVLKADSVFGPQNGNIPDDGLSDDQLERIYNEVKD